MQFPLVLLRADAFLTDVRVFAPTAGDQLNLFTDGPADGANFEHISDNVP
jgi:hypothetical protein